ncbi:MAG: hypothetical protein IJ565_01400 [Bacilli bacterium]|nr:hypothetical protein [Bacilli bacterium]
MKNKVLIKLVVPDLDETYDVFIPVNEVMWKIKAMFSKCISDIEYIAPRNDLDFIILNKITGQIYDNNDIIINTDIRNGTELVLLTKQKQMSN